MCLDKRFNEERTNKVLKKLPEKITVYKIVRKDSIFKKYTSMFIHYEHRYEYKEGENIARMGFANAGFYSFKTWFGAWFYKSFKEEKIIKYKIYKKDILFIGKQMGCLTFVSSKITVPKYKE